MKHTILSPVFTDLGIFCIRLVAKLLKRAAIVIFGVALSIPMIFQTKFVMGRLDFVEEPQVRLLSRNGKWVMESYLYEGYPAASSGVYRIYRTSDRHLEAEIHIPDYIIWSESQPFWSGNILYYANDDDDFVSLPANPWVQFLALLP